MESLENEWVFPLTAKQFFFLTQIMGAHHIAGFIDPFQGHLSSELESQYKIVEQELIKEKYLITKEGGIGFDLHEMLGACIAAAGSENVMFVRKHMEEVGEYEGYYYFMPNIVVERTQEDSHEIVLVPVANASITMDAMRGFFPLTLRGRSTHSPIILSECSWEKWDGLERKEKQDLLISSGCEPDTAESMLNVIYSATHSGSMVFMKRNGYKWHQEGYHYFHLEEELYLIRELSEDRIQIEPYKPEVIKKALDQFKGYLDIPVHKGVE